ncbi:MAG: aconitase X catalytic domain-containing protein [Deltaproteobacteria bacterium]|jgi:predicted aconitase|nr:aconitase X catalytic domain-containing protein [Deltaproteobacteria bacterium]
MNKATKDSNFALTPLLQEMASGKLGPGYKKAFQLINGLARVYKSRRLIPVNSVQISGVSYKNIGKMGIEFLKSLASPQVRVPTTLNPACYEPFLQKLHLDEEIRGQNEIIKLYSEMGVQTSLTCAPYFYGNKPEYSQHIAWAESSAVVYANSVLGARTNREGGPSALAAALTGFTPEYGLHLTDNRRPQVKIILEKTPANSLEWGLLGCWTGINHKNTIPLFFPESSSSPTEEDLQSLGAALITWGGAPLFHISQTTPEADIFPEPENSVNCTIEDLEIIQRQISYQPQTKDEIDFVYLGCPHYSIAKLDEVFNKFNAQNIKTGIGGPHQNLLGEIPSSSGLTYFGGSCIAVSYLLPAIRTVATNSVKACFYLMNRGIKTVLLPEDECLNLK